MSDTFLQTNLRDDSSDCRPISQSKNNNTGKEDEKYFLNEKKEKEYEKKDTDCVKVKV
jgi:hypothetical protein